MAERLMIECDNPKCESVGRPEFVPGQDGPKRKGDRLMGPYGWHQGDIWVVGSGPSGVYMACSDDCLGPAALEVLRRAAEKDRIS